MDLWHKLSAHWLLAATAAVGLAAGAAQADERADTVLGAAKAASGGSAWDGITGLQQNATGSTGGLTGTAHVLVDTATGSYAEDYDLGPASGRDGFDGSVAWSVDPSGQPRVEGGGEARLAAVNHAYRASMAYWYKSRHPATMTVTGQKTDSGETFDVVRIVPQGGRPFDFWVNARTHVISRMVEQGENDLTTEYYSAFTPVQGAMIPASIRVSIGDPKYDQLLQVTRTRVVPAMPASRFAIPLAPPPDFAFPAGQDRVSVPIELANNHIYLPVTVNGHTVPFIFDTGASNVIDKESQAALGVADQGALPGGGVGDAKQDVGLARVPRISVGGLTIDNQVFATIGQEKWGRVEGKTSNGLIGYEVAKRVVVVIDYARARITFIKPSAFRPPQADPIHITFNDHTPQIEGALDGIEGKFDIDTGSRATVDIPGPFAQAHQLAAKYHTSQPVITGWGVGGPARSRVTYASKLTLGGITIRNPLIELSEQKKGALASPYIAGNVGGGVLRRFTVTLDYPHATMYLQENDNFAEPDVFDRSGMWLIQSENGKDADVVDVMGNSAAAAAGIATGERIVAVDGESVGSLSIPEVRARFKQKVGTPLMLTVAGASGTREVKLTLKDVMM